MKNPRLVLASNSPRRQEYLRRLGVSFVVRTRAVEEDPLPGERPADMVARLARLKAEAAPLYNSEIVIAADTVVVLDGRVLGKPQDDDDARRMLLALRDRTHLVHTGLALRRAGETWSETDTALVHMRDYSATEVEAYIASGLPLDKAGAYGIQNEPFSPADRVEGCYMTVVGLPLCRLAQALMHWDVHLPRIPPDHCHSILGQPCPAALFC